MESHGGNMVRLIAEYRIKKGSEDEVLDAIREFVAAVKREEPETEYSAFRRAGARNFMHIMAFPDEVAQNRHRKADYTMQFVSVLYPNCEEEPKFTSIDVVE
jgi:quinol monooxygenase YgiN